MTTGRSAGAARLAALAVMVLVVGCRPSAPAKVEVSRISLHPADAPAGNVPADASAPARVAAGSRVVADFTVRNAGGSDLIVHGVVRDCGCELTSPVPEALAPGHSAEIGVACRAPLAEGTTVRELHLVSDDPESPSVALQVPMTTAGTRASPAAVYFGYVAVGGSASRDVTAGPSNGGGAEASAPKASSDVIAVERKPDNRTYVLRFTPNATGPIHVDVDLGAGVHVAASGVGFRSVLAYPAEVRLPSATTASGPPPIAIKGVGEEPLEIMRVDFPPGLAGDLQAVTPGHEYRLSLRRRDAALGADAAIRLHTTSPSDRDLTIPVIVEARS